MKRLAGIAAVLFWTLWATASAQAPNPVTEHFRAYRAALEANDLATAETEAAAALAASEQRDGDGGPTAVLAFNLASLRLERGDDASALAPAQRALMLARAGAAGVSVTMAGLIASRAELANGDASAADRLQAALDAAQQEQVGAPEIHQAAVELAIWSYGQERFAQSQYAWSVAAAYAEGSPLGAPFAESRARTGEAAAILLDDIDGRRRGARIRTEAAREAFQKLERARVLIVPLAMVDVPNGQMTIAQRAYAETLAWMAILRAKLLSDHQSLPEIETAQGDGDGMAEVGAAALDMTRPRCWVNVGLNNPSQHFPEAQRLSSEVAGVAVRIAIDANGRITSVEPAAVVGDPEFGEALDDPSDWYVRRFPNSPANCRMNMTLIRSVTFRFS